MTRRIKLTVLNIKTLGPGDYPDATFPGLTFRVGKNRRTWTLRHWVGGAQRREKLGYYHPDAPDAPNNMGLVEARNAARKISERIDSGAPTIVEPVVHPRQELTLGKLIDKYEKMRRKEGPVSTAMENGWSAIRRFLKDYLSLPAKSFSKANLRAVRDEVSEKKPSAANRFLGALGPVFTWAAQEDLIEVNFVRDIRKSKETARDRVLTHDEIGSIWHACDRLEGPSSVAFGRLVRFALLTAQRRDECADLRHGDILNATWRQSKNKANRPHAIPLPALAIELVGTGEARDIVFAGRTGRMSGWSKMKPELDRQSGVTGWTLHDLRRTAASGLQDLDIDEQVIKSILNHAIPGVSARYMRSTLEPQKGAALALWADAIAAIVAAKQSSSTVN
ncbi:tyrosine-type recombinase/integrase [Phyllobacterium chamaecytisi]|uniref:tyrosine-type recombinase/integrase n=1 Tax=Phyllobacterium chamaecytisi TaxID=2876082 RepID=UPI001CCE820E|nr:tyrosine-type recombinase/integrase [Phyllobacterium sp. KW56]MBZ9604256.1 tyrosine-type recombinase/integrase [Phyllobacterium sp. KW56]